MEHKEFFIWCDESIKKGKFYSNFYGGVLVKSKDYEFVINQLKNSTNQLNITEEIKWQKVDAFKLPAFQKLIDVFFELVQKDKIKVRIMFTHNVNKPLGLKQEHFNNEYFLLYYQFVKHHFGLPFANPSKNPIHLRLYFDDLPDTYAKRAQFKEYIKGLEKTKPFINAKIKIRKEDIVEVNSKEHLPLQLLDVVLGAMQYRLNDLHKEKPEGKKQRGKRTIAKEKLYKYINNKIREIKPNFNIGISTGIDTIEDRWNHPYRHWKFTPKDFEIDENGYK